MSKNVISLSGVEKLILDPDQYPDRSQNLNNATLGHA